MADSELIRVVSLRSGLLTASALHALASNLDASEAVAIVLDCSAVEALSPDGLAALLALGQRTAGKLSLAGLSRPLLRTAVQARLARYFAIYSTPAAFSSARQQAERPS